MLRIAPEVLYTHGRFGERCLGSESADFYDILAVDGMRQRPKLPRQEPESKPGSYRRISARELAEHEALFDIEQPPYNSFVAWREWWSMLYVATPKTKK